ncbi:hypothetical protein LXL04_035189 [Taraxacum kok-saghyz]
MMPWPPSTPGFDPPHASGAINITDEDDKDGFTSAKRNRSSNIVASDDKTILNLNLNLNQSREADSYDELEPENALNEYKASLDKNRRKKELKLKWELEGDMQQTEDEKVGKVTIYYNERGFSQFDALRGSNVAEFLTDGDPNCDLNKTVEELERYDAKGVELCMTLAAKYSKQLFQIYQNKEDPYFLP